MTVSELITELEKFDPDDPVHATVFLTPEAVTGIVRTALEFQGEEFTLTTEVGEVQQMPETEIPDGLEGLPSLTICGMCLAGVDHEGSTLTH